MAASTIGLSTALLSLTGVASATTDSPIIFSTDPGDTTPDHVLAGPSGSLVVPAGYCSVDWQIAGASGGASTGNDDGSNGTLVHTTTSLPGTSATTFSYVLGAVGGDGDTAGGTGGAGGHGHDGTNGVVDSNDVTVFGGGGGGATTVDDTHGLLVEAPGGDGGDGGDAAGGDGAGGGEVFPADAETDYPDQGAGTIYAEADPCTPDPSTPSDPGSPASPAAPYLNYADGNDGSLTLDFVDRSTDPGDVPAVGFEWTKDNGDHWAPLTTTTSDGRIDATVTGLTNGTTYTVAVRAVGGPNTVPSDMSNTVQGTPVRKAGAPTNVRASVSAAAITLTWAPPAGESDIVGYHASAIPGENPQSSHGMVRCPDLGADARSCTLTVSPGQKYTVGVSADNGNGGAGVFLVTDVVPALSSPPAGVGAVKGANGAVLSNLTAGQAVTLTGDGYAPYSTVSLYVYSTPTLLGTATTDENGAFSTSVTLPAGLAPGAHHLVTAGLDPSGNLRYLRTDITVATPGNQLAWTGFETLPWVGAGVLAVALGAGMVVVTRRRRTA